MALEWLFGVDRTDPMPGHVTLRSLKLEIDTVLEVLDILRSADIGEVSGLSAAPGTMRGMFIGNPIDLSTLATAPTWQLDRLALVARSGPPVNVSLDVWINAGGPAEVRMHVPDPANELPEASAQISEVGDRARAAFETIVNKLQLEGRPRPIFKPWLLRLPWLAFLGLLGAYMWTLADLRPPFSVSVFAALLLAPAAAAAAWAQASWRPHIAKSGAPVGSQDLLPGCRISPVTRRETRERRSAAHAGLKQFAITAPTSALLGAAVTLIVQRGG